MFYRHIMFVSLYYWNYSGDRGRHVGQPCHKRSGIPLIVQLSFIGFSRSALNSGNSFILCAHHFIKIFLCCLEISHVRQHYLFQNILLKYYDAIFPISYVNKKITKNKWITIGIRKSCTRKRELYSEYNQNENDIQIRNRYRIYCRILKKVIIEAKNNTIIN